jgi:hypothetical protein
MPRNVTRTEYCKQQAARCGAAAMTTPLSEVKAAYLNLEQGWLRLALDLPESELGQNSPATAKPDESAQPAKLPNP